jgi:hypothetical protein
MRKHMSVALIVLAAGCGGKQKVDESERREPFRLQETDPEYEDADDVLVPPEAFDEIDRELRRRSPAVSRCFAALLEDDKLPKAAKGRVIVAMKISAQGKAQDVHVLPASTIRHDELDECVIKEVRAARLPTLPKMIDFSYTYQLERDY